MNNSSSACTLIHSPSVSNSLCSSLRQPSNYIGLSTIRPSTHLEALLHKTTMGRKVRKNEKGDVVGKERALDAVIKEKAEVTKTLVPLESQFPDTRNLSKADRSSPNFFLLMKSRARLKRLDSLISEISLLKKSKKTEQLTALGVADEYDQNRQTPLMLSDAASRYALSCGNIIISGSNSTSIIPKNCPGYFEGLPVSNCCDLACSWVCKVEAGMEGAVKERMEEENIRAMPYTVTPEVWKRMNPMNGEGKKGEDVIVGGLATVNGPVSSDPKSHSIPFAPLPPLNAETEEAVSLPATTLAVAYANLQGMGLHVSCGAKFGADFLIYDGPRDGRHAFGGVRCYGYRKVVGVENEGDVKPPRAQDLAGFVRGLNTVGKIGLLAFVEEQVERREGAVVTVGYRVGYVDLVLEKILTAETHKKRGRTEKRKDMSKNLSKEDDNDNDKGGGKGKKGGDGEGRPKQKKKKP
ncbi:hypothetical protein TrST_g5408 [Triparma strigata]|uniref:tRNA-intron lyase n=1 Tax=Triparma strigata TaxID=1606541 RepID=A0A9W7EGF2_9STRA|nr:hypothetical protein TrST_g5408 [Triparma strigata]